MDDVVSRKKFDSSSAQRILEAIGTMEARQVRSATYDDIADAGFRVYSQFDEDGIIQYLLGKVPVENEVFVEIGVEDYTEANTRFLLVHDNWKGIIVDAGTAHIDLVRDTAIGWRHDITPISAFVEPDNINDVIEGAGLLGDIGLLSLDIDGNDYWIAEALDVVSPRIQIFEYNSLFGPELAVTIPYTPGFARFKAHHSGLYWGASLAALEALMTTRGYVLVGTNRAGHNAFFVRSDVGGNLKAISASEAWRPTRIREARDEKGKLTFASERATLLDAMADLPLVNLETGDTELIRDLYGLSD